MSGLGGAYFNGSLAQPKVGQMYADIILNTLTAYAMSHGWYAGIVKKEEKKPPLMRRPSLAQNSARKELNAFVVRW
jgi:hypothetical protein